MDMKEIFAGVRAYGIWVGIRTRCTNKRTPYYHRYGGRGISMHPSWQSFETFLTDVGLPPDGMSLDRINNDGNYEPGNCRWASYETQANNKSSNQTFAYDGQTLTLTQWSKKAGIPYGTVRRRFQDGKTPEEILGISPILPNIEIAREASTARLRALTHCANGHEFTKENTIIRLNGNRACKECGRDRSREFYRKKHNTKGRQK